MGADPPALAPDVANPPGVPYSERAYRLSHEAYDSPVNLGGSGCSPSSDAAMPDGLWYGLVNRLEGGVVWFDLACAYVGDHERPPSCEYSYDFCVVNDSASERTVPLAADAVFNLPHDYDEGLFNESASFEEFAMWLGLPGNTLYVWIRVAGDALVELEVEQQLAG